MVGIKTWLVHVTEDGTEKIHKIDSEDIVVQYCASVMGGSRANTTIHKLLLVDVEECEILEKEAVVENFILGFAAKNDDE